ncbi:methylcrotonoyl-CoA carboxylase subunit alpha, mitochondrial-like [Ctenocephalides felis]|uniref:methylcrotonoyl-CoA carboxylase subunit alpha, mitochondrial-like n=2 Tax=Ctenocephalides felis TaxID=7515 RepID=UPI000E6E371B|nr:methylcrotonoyl-CoA carboxylase subunit alpha, mitochondrial-like [Ctenocephalides felis]
MWNFSRFIRSGSSQNPVISRWRSTQVKPSMVLKPINKVLIANRGEIACRIMRTAKRLGVQTVAVYSDADAKSMHVQMADEAYNIGPPPSQQSYLCADKILDVAKKSGSHAVHPGYGFLSENLEFAEACQNSDIIFIGPPSSAIRDMGIKSTSKAIMSAAGVPCIKGYHGDDQSDEKLIAEAERIGFPLMIKAVRGGGGKGMRMAETMADFLPALESARTESLKAFGDTNMLLENYVTQPRHVEVQVFADKYGEAVHLFERDCSVQRRHQKVIEEAPAPGISQELRMELGAAAVRAAKAVGYVGAGTVEFILDKKSHAFHFMEMNTRLQVEHPITEYITGTDLVEWQLRIAGGEPLPVTQEDITLSGHAFEARIYAEDPRGGFLPGAGPLRHLRPPQTATDVRVETGVREGDEVSIHYDPMIAKLVVWGEDRTQALTKLKAKLTDYHIMGLETNVNFLLDLASHPNFAAGDVHTGFIDEHRESLFPPLLADETSIGQAIMGLILNERVSNVKNAYSTKKMDSPYFQEMGFRLNHSLERTIKLTHNDKDITVQLQQVSSNVFQMKVGPEGQWRTMKAVLTEKGGGALKLTLDGVISNCSVVMDHDILSVFDVGGRKDFKLHVPKFITSAGDGGSGGSAGAAVSPMPGVLEKLFVSPGDKVEKGTPLAVIIAMKMEHVIKASKDGTVASVNSNLGKSVQKGATIVKFEEDAK